MIKQNLGREPLIRHLKARISVSGLSHDNWYLSHMHKKPSINAHADKLSGTRCLILHLHFVYTSSEGSDESAHLQMRRPV